MVHVMALPSRIAASGQPSSRPLAHMHEGRLMILLAWLLGAVPATGQKVQWQLSKAEKDVSCDWVCEDRGLRCTEQCWPASVTGLDVALKAPHIKGSCFQVSEGPAKEWHPAKDSDNTFCYWNPGHLSQARCPILSQTLAPDSQEGRWVRRLCPCLNRTVIDASDCGFGSELAAPSFDAVVSTVAPTSAPSNSGPTSAPTSAPKPSLPKNFVAVPHACNLCVNGFSSDDESLNGRYVRSGASWKKGVIVFAKADNGHWQFRERQMAGDYIPVSQGSLLPENLLVPESDFFTTSTAGWKVDFSTCCGHPSAEDPISANAAGSDDVSHGISATAIVIIILSALVAVGVSIAVVCYRQRVRHGRKSAESKPAWSDDAVSPPELPDLPDPEWGLRENQGLTGDPHKLRAVALSKTAAPPVPPMPPKLTDAHSHGVYEGPVQPWWGEGGGNTSSSGWQLGDKVRLCGLGATSTWNGTVGVVDMYEKGSGLIKVKLSDGRVKSVRPENCESADVPLRNAAGWRGKAEALPPLSRSIAGTGVTTWLSSAPSSKQEGNSQSWAKPLPTSAQQIDLPIPPSWNTQQPSRAHVGQQPPIPPSARQPISFVPVGGRSASTGPRIGPDASPGPATSARRCVSSGPSGRGGGANSSPTRCTAMSLAPGAPAADSMQRPMRSMLQDDLMAAQKRSQAKLAALKMQIR